MLHQDNNNNILNLYKIKKHEGCANEQRHYWGKPPEGSVDPIYSINTSSTITLTHQLNLYHMTYLTHYIGTTLIHWVTHMLLSQIHEVTTASPSTSPPASLILPLPLPLAHTYSLPYNLINHTLAHSLTHNLSLSTQSFIFSNFHPHSSRNHSPTCVHQPTYSI